MKVEITELLDLTQEQAALIDMHSVLNIMNVLLNELEYLQEMLRESKALQPALDTVQQIREHLRSSNDIGVELGHLLKCEDRVMGVVRVVIDTHPEAADNLDVEDSVSNLQSVFAILDNKSKIRSICEFLVMIPLSSIFESVPRVFSEPLQDPKSSTFIST